VSVVDRHAGDGAARLAERGFEIDRARVVRLDREEDLAAREIVVRVAREVRMLVAERLELAGGGAVAAAAHEHVAHLLRLAQETELARRVALARELREELAHRRLDARIEIADPLLPVLGQVVHEVGQPTGARLEEAEAQERERLHHAVEDQLRERHLLHRAIREHVHERERVELVGDSARELHARRAVDADRHVEPLALGVQAVEVGMRERLRHADRGEVLGRIGMRRRQVRRDRHAGHAQLDHAAAQLVDGGDRILERQHRDRVQPVRVRLRVVVDVVVVGAAQRDRELGVDQRVECERHRAVDHLVIDALAIHVLDAHAVEQAADRRLAVIGAIGALAVALHLQEYALEIARARARIEVEDAEALLAVAVAHERHAAAIARRDVVEEDGRVLALVTVGVDDGLAVDHARALRAPPIADRAVGLRGERVKSRESPSDC
jgi:hypothetical protein